MGKIWHVIRRTIFWAYERGTWQYDLLVIAIVLFVFLAPRSWFRDQPRESQPAQSANVQLLSEDADLGTKTYRVDVSAVGGLAVKQRTPELERKAHDFLRNSVPELKSRSFRIERIEAVVGNDGAVLYYSVQVK
jgi:hypothetical protein